MIIISKQSQNFNLFMTNSSESVVRRFFLRTLEDFLTYHFPQNTPVVIVLQRTRELEKNSVSQLKYPNSHFLLKL